MIELRDAIAAAERFTLQGVLVGLSPYGCGHINDTYLAECRQGTKPVRYILQAINTSVFPDAEGVVRNIEAVTTYLKRTEPDPRRVMTLVPKQQGGFLLRDEAGRAWRTYEFIEDSLCLQRPETTQDFYQCAVAFGDFQRRLSGFPAEQLNETIPDFHNTPKRYETFLRAVEADVKGRADGVRREIDFVCERAAFYGVLMQAHAEGRLPLRVTHNDTKCNNVMLDAKTREALCVIDLDTIMPGFSVNDFGDAIRFGANTAAEDETDLSRVRLDMELFRAYASGFLTGCGGKLTAEEVRLLPEGAKMMTMECGMRFLTDYLQGDTYFKTAYETHNLVRCRTQFQLVEEMEAHWEEMKEVVAAFR